MKKKFFIAVALLCLSFLSIAQDTKTEMADMMRSNGKIYVVIAVILTIFAGLIIYLMRVDRKIAKLEKGTNH